MSKSEHGTRARYVQEKCRCAACREANRRYYHERQAKLREVIQAGLDGIRNEPKLEGVPQLWKPRGQSASRVRVRRRACPGVLGQPCAKKRYLRKDSLGGLCSDCREHLVRADLVSPENARTHLLFLSRNNVGMRRAARMAGVGVSTIQGIKAGKVAQIARATEERILKVSVIDKADGALVDSAPTQKLIAELMTVAKMPRSEIASHLYGRSCLSLQLSRKRITNKNAKAVKALHHKVMQDLLSDPGVRMPRVTKMINDILKETGMTRKALAKELGWVHLKLSSFRGYVRTHIANEVKSLHEKYVTGVMDEVPNPDACGTCGLSHGKEARLARLVPMLPCTYRDILEAYPCVYPNVPAGQRALHRDLHEVADVTEVGGGPNLWVQKPTSGSAEDAVASGG